MTDEVKEEIKEIIEEAVEEVAEVITEGETAQDEVEETTTQIDETVEQTESLMLLYNVIRENGVSAPIIKLIDANGSFRKAVSSDHPTVSFESLSTTPDFGELKVACEATIMENIKKGVNAVWEFIKKIARKIRDYVIAFINYFISYETQFNRLEPQIKELALSPGQEKSANIKEVVKLSKEKFEKLITDASRGGSVGDKLAKIMDDVVGDVKARIIAKNSNDFNETLLSMKENVARQLGGNIKDGKFKSSVDPTEESDSDKGKGWSVKLVQEYKDKTKLAIRNITKKNATQFAKIMTKPLDDLAEEAKKLEKDENASAKATAIGKLASFMSSTYMSSLIPFKVAIDSWIKAARSYTYVNSKKAIDDKEDITDVAPEYEETTPEKHKTSTWRKKKIKPPK